MALTKVTSGLISADASSVDLNIDAGTLYIDATNNRVGVGTTSPAGLLDVNNTSNSHDVAIFRQNNASYNTDIVLYHTSSSSDNTLITKRSNGDLWLYQSTAKNIAFFTTSSERMRIDSSGNVGIGTSSPSAPLNISATYSSDTTEQFRIQDNTGGKLDFFGYANAGKGLQAYADDGSTFYNLNLQPLGGNVGIGTSSPARLLDVFGGDAIFSRSGATHQILFGDAAARYFAIETPAGAANFKIRNITNSVDIMTFAQAGNVGIGTSSPSSFADGGLTLGTTSSGKSLIINCSSNGGNGLIHFNNSSGNALQVGSGTNESYLYSYQAAPLVFYVNSAERMRILSSGALCVGRTSAITSSSVAAAFQTSAADSVPAIDVAKVSGTTSSSAYFISFHASSGGTAMGAIAGNGAANVQFIAVSDQRLKENIQPLLGSLDKVLALNPVSYDWKENGEHIEAGFVAQEVEQVLPEYVSTKDDENQTKSLTGGMTAGYIAVLTKAIQEQQVLIEQLQAEVALLKGE